MVATTTSPSPSARSKRTSFMKVRLSFEASSACATAVCVSTSHSVGLVFR